MFVVTEGEADAEFLRWMLDDELKEGELEIRSARGKSSAESLARSLLASKREPLALIIDADSVDPGTIEELQEYYSYSLHQAGGSTPSCVVLMKPALEVVAFYDPDLLKLVSSRKLTDREDLEAQFKPKEVLSKSLATQSSFHPLLAFTKAVKEIGAGSLRRHPEIVALTNFLREAGTRLSPAIAQ
jgi:hypothetical protein